MTSTPQLSPIQSGTIDQFQINSNSGGGGKDMSAGVTDLRYYESILSNNITATCVINETGFEAGNGGKAEPSKGTVDSLPIRGGERTDIDIKDEYGNRLQLEMYVNRVRNSAPSATNDLYWLDFVSKEAFANETSRVNRRYDGKISQHVQDIVSGVLRTNTSINVDETAVDYNFIGNNRKPFHVITWLASKATPQTSPGGGTGGSALGGAAGYFFYQTRDSFNFKAIDVLFKGEPVKKFIKNNGDPVPGYDANIINYQIDRDVDVKESLTLGVYHNRTIFFDPLAFNYNVRLYDINQQEDKLSTAGDRDKFAPSLLPTDLTQAPTRFMSVVLDNGVLPEGADSGAQLEEWRSNMTQPNYDSPNTQAQSVMRYNQLFTIQINITIPGDFSIKAGDLVECAFQEVSGGESKEINPETKGIYMVAHVCHNLTPSATLTSLSLIRDSYGIRPGP